MREDLADLVWNIAPHESPLFLHMDTVASATPDEIKEAKRLNRHLRRWKDWRLRDKRTRGFRYLREAWEARAAKTPVLHTFYEWKR